MMKMYENCVGTSYWSNFYLSDVINLTESDIITKHITEYSDIWNASFKIFTKMKFGYLSSENYATNVLCLKRGI